MLPYSAARLAHGLKGRLLSSSNTVFESVSTDSRKIQRGDVFVALKGESFDGEKFYGAAAKAGAKALVGRKPPKLKGVTSIAVKDSLLALQSLAADQRAQFHGPVIAITGSNGKTSTKECLGYLMGDKALVTPGNLNNHVGLPLTLCGLKPRQSALVLELGMNHYGELACLGAIAKPTVAIELNVGHAHLEFFKTREGVAKAKEELLTAMGPGGIAVLNADDARVVAMGKRFGGRQLSFGLSSKAQLRATKIVDRGVRGLTATVSFDGQRGQLSLQAGGQARLMCSLAALGGAIAAGKSFKGSLAALRGFKPAAKGRQQYVTALGAHFILDAYNASPQSMQAGLALIAHSAPAGRRLAVLGDMLELGAASKRLHQELGREAKRAGLRRLFALGPHASEVAKGFGKLASVYRKDEAAVLAVSLKQELRQGDWVLLKGSRGMAIERVFQALHEKGS